MRGHLWWDRAGALVSGLCALHCAGLGLVFVLYPGLWLRRQAWPFDLAWLLYVEWTLAGLALVLATIAFGRGCRIHRSVGPICLAVPGVVLMGAGVFTNLHWWPVWGSAIVLTGGMLLVAAHLLNLVHLKRFAHAGLAAGR